MRRMRSRSSSFSMAISAMSPFCRRRCSSGWATGRTLSASAPADRKRSRYSRGAPAAAPNFRLVDSGSAPRSSSGTTPASRLAEPAALSAATGFCPRIGRARGSFCGSGHRNIHVGSSSPLVSQISVKRNLAAGGRFPGPGSQPDASFNAANCSDGSRFSEGDVIRCKRSLKILYV